VTLQKRRHHMSNFKTSSSLKRSAVEHIETHNDNEIATDSSDSDFVKEVFNKDKRVTLKVITRLRIQKNKWLIWKKTESNAVRAFSESILVKLSRHFKNSMYATLNSFFFWFLLNSTLIMNLCKILYIVASAVLA